MMIAAIRGARWVLGLHLNEERQADDRPDDDDALADHFAFSVAAASAADPGLVGR